MERERESSREIFMNMLPSMKTGINVGPKLMFEVRMTARIFGMTIVIPQTNELNNEE